MPMSKLARAPFVINMARQFDRLSSREKSYVKIMVVAVVVAALYFVVWLPSHNFLLNAKSSLEDAQDTLKFVKENIGLAEEAAKKQSSQGSVGGDQNLVGTVSSVGKRFGVDLKRFEPSGDSKLRIWLEDVPFNSMVQWLDELSKSHQLKVVEISIDRDDKPGLINARMLISG